MIRNKVNTILMLTIFVLILLTLLITSISIEAKLSDYDFSKWDQVSQQVIDFEEPEYVVGTNLSMGLEAEIKPEGWRYIWTATGSTNKIAKDGANKYFNVLGYMQLSLNEPIEDPYSISADIRATGTIKDDQTIALFVRSSTEYMKFGASPSWYYEHDNSNGTNPWYERGIGATGFYIMPVENRIELNMKVYDPSKPYKIANVRYAIPVDVNFATAMHKITVIDDGSTASVFVGEELVVTISFSKATRYDDIERFYTSPPQEYYSKAVITKADGTVLDTLTNAIISTKSVIAFASRASKAHIDNIVLTEYTKQYESIEYDYDFSKWDQVSKQKIDFEEEQYVVGQNISSGSTPKGWNLMSIVSPSEISKIGDNKYFNVLSYMQLYLQKPIENYYSVSADISAIGLQTMGFFVRASTEVFQWDTNVSSYYEQDRSGTVQGSQGLGATGFYVKPSGRNIILTMKVYDASKTYKVSNVGYVFPTNVDFETGLHKITIIDDGSTVSIIVEENLILTIDFSNARKYDDIPRASTAPKQEYYSKAVISSSDGVEVDTLNNALISKNSIVAFGSRGSKFKIDNIEITEYIDKYDFSKWNQISKQLIDFEEYSVGSNLSSSSKPEGWFFGYTAQASKIAKVGENKYYDVLSYMQLYLEKPIENPYSISADISAIGSQTMGFFVRSSTEVMKFTNPGDQLFNASSFYEHDRSNYDNDKTLNGDTRGIGATGFYIKPFKKSIVLTMKVYDPVKFCKISNKTYEFPVNVDFEMGLHKITIVDDGSTVSIFVADEFVGTISFSKSRKYDEIPRNTSDPKQEYFSNAVISTADGTVLARLTNALISKNSVVAFASRGSTFKIDNIELTQYLNPNFMPLPLESGAYKGSQIRKTLVPYYENGEINESEPARQGLRFAFENVHNEGDSITYMDVNYTVNKVSAIVILKDKLAGKQLVIDTLNSKILENLVDYTDEDNVAYKAVYVYNIPNEAIDKVISTRLYYKCTNELTNEVFYFYSEVKEDSLKTVYDRMVVAGKENDLLFNIEQWFPSYPLGAKTELYQVAPENSSLMMSYVIKTKNNKLIVIDGGIDGSGLNAETYLLDFLKDLQGTDKPEIEAWFFSHIHRDHVHEFIKMVDTKQNEFTVNNFYFNFPTRNFIESNCSVSEINCYNEFVAAFNKIEGVNAYESYIAPQVGANIRIDDISFEILQVPDNTTTVNTLNNSSMVFRMTSEGQKILFLGDLGVEGGNKLIEKYNSEIQSDMVQMAHHGQSGVNKNVYDLINPRLCLWPTPLWVWDNKDSNGVEGKGQFQTTLVRKWMYEDLGIKHHFVSALDGTQKIELPFNLD